MDPIEVLETERTRIEAARAEACAGFDAQIAELSAAIDAIKAVRAGSVGVAALVPGSAKATMTVDDAIIKAVGDGKRAPAQILIHLAQEFDVHTTINSVRTRVSRLKNGGRLYRDDRGWILPSEVSEGLPLNENEDAAASPDEDARDARTSLASSPNPSLTGA